MQAIMKRECIARGLLSTAAVGACSAFLITLPDALHVDAATQMVEVWQLVDFIVFAGLFGLLAWQPQHYSGVWELTILYKGVVAVTGLVLAHTTTVDALNIAISDGILAFLSVSTYVLARGYKSWSRV